MQVLASPGRIKVFSESQFLECCHDRHGDKHYFFVVVDILAPRGSHVIFGFGEIDCREGFVISVQKCIYKVPPIDSSEITDCVFSVSPLAHVQDIEEGCGVAIDFYIKALLEVQRQKEYHIYIQPAAPVIDVTRYDRDR